MPAAAPIDLEPARTVAELRQGTGRSLPASRTAPSSRAAQLLTAFGFALMVFVVGATPAGARALAVAREAVENELTFAKAALLGLVEGVTEFLPISSTGHLVVTERLLGLGTDEATKAATDTYTIAIQIGAILAVLAIYWRRCLSVAKGALGRDADGRRTLNALVVAFIPAAAMGVLFDTAIENVLLEPVPVALAWIVGGIVILAFFRTRPDDSSARTTTVSAITPRQALLIGLAQSVALWPGVSRSLVTIIGALLVGIAMDAAVEFSFLLGLITLSAATGYKLLSDGGELVDRFGIATPLFGAVVAFVAAFVSVKWMIAYLTKRGLGVFGWYRIAAGAVVLVLVAAGTKVA